MATKMEPEAVDAALEGLNGWSRVDGRDAVCKIFKFADFNQAFGFMTLVAAKAEAMNHHPEWSNIYNRVDVTLTTHDADGVSLKDVELAMFMDEAE